MQNWLNNHRNLRLTFAVIILATIPCYCTGLIVLALKPDSGIDQDLRLGTITSTISQTPTTTLTPYLTRTPTITSTPTITPTITETATITATVTQTITPTETETPTPEPGVLPTDLFP